MSVSKIDTSGITIKKYIKWDSDADLDSVVLYEGMSLRSQLEKYVQTNLSSEDLTYMVTSKGTDEVSVAVTSAKSTNSILHTFQMYSISSISISSTVYVYIPYTTGSDDLAGCNFIYSNGEKKSASECESGTYDVRYERDGEQVATGTSLSLYEFVHNGCQHTKTVTNFVDDWGTTHDFGKQVIWLKSIKPKASGYMTNVYWGSETKGSVDFSGTVITFTTDAQGVTTLNQRQVSAGAGQEYTLSELLGDYTIKTTSTIVENKTARYTVTFSSRLNGVTTILASWSLLATCLFPTSLATSVYSKLSSVYYSNHPNTFHKPKLTFIAKMNDGSTKSYDPTADEIEYKTSENEFLYEGKAYEPENTVNVVLLYKKLDGESVTLSTSYDNTITEDVATSIEAKCEGYKGNASEYYLSNGSVTVTFESGYVDTSKDGVTVKITNSGGDSKTYVIEDSDKVIYSYGDVSTEVLGSVFEIPSAKSVTVNTDDIDTILFNNIDYPDIRNAFVTIEFSDATYIQKVATYAVKEKGVPDSTGTFSAYNSALGDSFTYDGKSLISVTMDDSYGDKDLTIDIIAMDDFGGVNKASLKLTVISVKQITEVKLAGNPYTNYSVGDRFITSEPEGYETNLYVYYISESGVDSKKRMTLKQASSFLNITPYKGMKLTKPQLKMDVEISLTNGGGSKITYSIVVRDNLFYSATNIMSLRAVKSDKDITIKYGDGELDEITAKAGTYFLFREYETTIKYGKRVLMDGKTITDKITKNGYEYSFEGSGLHVYGYLSIAKNDDGTIDTRVACHVILFNDYERPTSTSANVVVTYPVYVPNNADYINKCTFGKLFGINNYKNRLFVSGNPDYANFDWHSGGVTEATQSSDAIDSDGDYTYFSDGSATPYGSTNNSIIGYEIISTSKMVVMKTESALEPTAYYVSSTTMDVSSAEGTISDTGLVQEAFKQEIGNPRGYGICNHNSMLSFNGDTVMLTSERMVEGLIVDGGVGDMQRITKNRSKFIDADISSIDLEKSFLWSDNVYLYLVTPDNMYIANYKKYVVVSQYNSNVSHYEWWKTDVSGVTCICKHKGVLYAGKSDGSLMKMDNGTYYDVEKTNVNTVNWATVDPIGNIVTISKSLLAVTEGQENCTFSVYQNDDDPLDDIYYQIGDISDTEKGGLEFLCDEDGYLSIYCKDSEGNIDYAEVSRIEGRIAETTPIYLNHVRDKTWISDSDLNEKYLGVPLKIEFIADPDSDKYGKYRLMMDDGTQISADVLKEASLTRPLRGEYEMSDIDIKEGTFSLSDGIGDIDIVLYGQQIESKFYGAIKTKTPVKSYYITAPMVMGSLDRNKTIWSWTITNDTKLESQLDVCVATNTSDVTGLESMVTYEKTDSRSNFGSFDFSDVSFDKDNIPHKLTYYRPLVVPFVCFAFRSLEPKNSVLSALQVSYNISSASFGDR